MRDSFPEMFGEQWQEAGEDYRRRYRAQHLVQLKPLAGALEVLQKLKTHNILLGIISNKTGDILRKEADALGWTAYFHQLIGSGDTGHDKPSPEPVTILLKDTGIAPQDVWFVGDSVVDVECARASGCLAVFYGNRFQYDGGKVTLDAHERHAPDHATFLEWLKA
jgi:phosphoglycolate phosphatase